MNSFLRLGTITALISSLMDQGKTYKEALRRAKSTTRLRNSCYSPHYGKSAAARNVEHAKNGTHGLHLSMLVG
jgi:hypothetical protein